MARRKGNRMKKAKVRSFIVNAIAALLCLAIVGVIYGFACAALVYLGVA